MTGGFKNIDEVKQFQRSHGLRLIDGKIGDKTIKALRAAGRTPRSEQQTAPKRESTSQQTTKQAAGQQSAGKQQKESKQLNGFQQAIADAIGPVVEALKPAHDNPIFGQRRTDLVGNYYGSNNPFRQGADAAANLTLLSAAAPAALGSVAGPLIFGEASLPAVVGQTAVSLGSGYLGGLAWDKGYEAATGLSWYDAMRNQGVWDINQGFMSPGAAAGAYYGPKLVLAVGANGIDVVPRQVTRQNVHPDAPPEVIAKFKKGEPIPEEWLYEPYSVEVPAGESVPEVLRITGEATYAAKQPFQKGTQGTSMYTISSRTTKGGVGGSAKGQPGRSQALKGNPSTQGVQNHYQADVLGRGLYTETAPIADTWTNIHTSTPYVFEAPTPWTPLYWRSTIEPPTIPPVTPPVMPPAEVEEDRYVEHVNPDAAFNAWFGQQPRNTVQYYSGDPYHPAGNYQIVLGNAGARDVRRVANQSGYINPDSTTVSVGSWGAPYRETFLVSGASEGTHGPEVMDVSGAVDQRPRKLEKRKKKWKTF